MAQPQQYSTNLGIGQAPDIDQAKYPTIYADLLRVRNAIRALQAALDTYTGALGEDPTYWDQVSSSSGVRLQNISRVYLEAGEPISYGASVHFYNVAGTLKARNANATDNTKPCRAYCSVSGGVSTGDFGEFILFGLHTGFVGLTPGDEYYLSAATPGGYAASAPGVVGNVVQKIGYALSDTVLFFEPVLDWTVV